MIGQEKSLEPRDVILYGFGSLLAVSQRETNIKTSWERSTIEIKSDCIQEVPNEGT